MYVDTFIYLQEFVHCTHTFQHNGRFAIGFPWTHWRYLFGQSLNYIFTYLHIYILHISKQGSLVMTGKMEVNHKNIIYYFHYFFCYFHWSMTNNGNIFYIIYYNIYIYILYWGNKKATGRSIHWTPSFNQLNFPGLPVASHFNSSGHSIFNAGVSVVTSCINDTNRKTEEERLNYILYIYIYYIIYNIYIYIYI